MILEGLKGFSAWLVYNKVVFSLVYLRRFNVRNNDQLALIEQLKNCETVEEYKAIADELNTDQFKTVFYSQSEVMQVFKSSTDDEKEGMLIEALTNILLDDHEILALLALHKDKNGVSYTSKNIDNLTLEDMLPMLIKSMLTCSNIHVDFSLLSEEDVKIISDKKIGIKDEANELLIRNPSIKTGELIALAVKSIIQKFKVFNHG